MVCIIDNFEDNHNIIRDLFVTDSVTVMKNKPLGAKKHKEISVFINMVQPHQKTLERATFKTFVSKTVQKLDTRFTNYFLHVSYEFLFITQVASYFLYASYKLLFIARVTSYFLALSYNKKR